MSKLETNTIDTVSGTSNLTIGSTNTSTITMPNGALSGQNYPSFFAKANGTQSITTTTYTKVEFQSVLYNIDSCFDTTNYRFTPGVAGKYFISAHIGIRNLDDTEFMINNMYKNGLAFSNFYDNQRVRGITSSPTASRTLSVQLSFVDVANTTDYYEVFAYQNDASTNVLDNSYGSWFTAYRIGA